MLENFSMAEKFDPETDFDDQDLWAFAVGYTGLGHYLSRADKREVLIKLLRELCQHYAGVLGQISYGIETFDSPLVRRIRLLAVPVSNRRGVQVPDVDGMHVVEDSGYLTWTDTETWTAMINAILKRFVVAAIPADEILRRIKKGQQVLAKFHHGEPPSPYPLPEGDGIDPLPPGR